MSTHEITITTDNGKASYSLDMPDETPVRIRELALLGLLYEHDWAPGLDSEITHTRKVSK